MMRRRGQGTALANPVLVGAITLLVVNVATVLAWTVSDDRRGALMTAALPASRW